MNIVRDQHHPITKVEQVDLSDWDLSKNWAKWDEEHRGTHGRKARRARKQKALDLAFDLRHPKGKGTGLGMV